MDKPRTTEKKWKTLLQCVQHHCFSVLNVQNFDVLIVVVVVVA